MLKRERDIDLNRQVSADGGVLNLKKPKLEGISLSTFMDSVMTCSNEVKCICIHMMEQQQYKEVILDYAVLLKEDKGQVTYRPSVGEECERLMYEVFKVKVEVPIDKTLSTLLRLSLATETKSVQMFTILSAFKSNKNVKNFNSLGYGDLLSFLENSTNQFPRDLLKLLGGGMCENSSIKACMSSNELVSLLSQAISRLWENETVTKQIISMLLMRKFPSIGFEFVESGSLEDLLDTV